MGWEEKMVSAIDRLCNVTIKSLFYVGESENVVNVLFAFNGFICR